jgi:hypothetical protein
MFGYQKEIAGAVAFEFIDVPLMAFTTRPFDLVGEDDLVPVRAHIDGAENRNTALDPGQHFFVFFDGGVDLATVARTARRFEGGAVIPDLLAESVGVLDRFPRRT